MSKKILSMLLAALMVVAVVLTTASCDDTSTENSKTESNTSGDTSTTEEVVYTDPFADLEGDERYEAIYNEALGEFLEAYEAAKAETDSLSKRFALMAIAEAKLLESGVMLPLTTRGGNYAISRVAPYTVPSMLWGNDSDRFHDAIVATDLIKAEDRAEMKVKYNELKGTGEYLAWVKTFLTEKGYTTKDSYTIAYSSDPQTWDALATSMAADSEAIVNTYDGLYEYDVEGTLKPALALSHTVTTTGEGDEMRTVYTFKIREGQIWVDSQGRKVADLTANDFVTGMQHMMDAEGGLEYLIQGVIVNASEYIAGDITDFAEVGVKATDDYTLEYTLIGNPTYFLTMLGYNCFAPMNKEYYVAQGGKFGADFNAEAEDYNYGKTPDNIAYCGPYLVENLTKESTIKFVLNDSYWNKDNVNIKTLTWLFNDGKDTTKTYEDCKAGILDGAGLNPSTIELSRTENYFEPYSYISSTDATSFMGFYNLDRATLHNFNDENMAVSPMTEEDVLRTNAAIRNASFRRALNMALDRGGYNAQTQGEELKLNSLRNSYTPGTFVSLEEETTVSINGTDKTYPAGTWYGQIMQDQIDADGVKIKVWDPAADDGVGSTDGFDGWYNAENAVAELNKAIEELAAIGIEVSAENPIQIDLPYWSGNESYTNRSNAYKQSIETVLGGKVKVNLLDCPTSGDWYNAAYYPTSGADMNYTIADVSGWGPDYGDPQTYLDTMLPDYVGYMVKSLGIY